MIAQSIEEGGKKDVPYIAELFEVKRYGV